LLDYLKKIWMKFLLTEMHQYEKQILQRFQIQ